MALNPQREAFARAIALDGMSQADALRAAYKVDHWKDTAIHQRASHLAKDSNVLARIEELKRQVETTKIMSAQKRKEKLTEIVNTSPDMNEVMKAIDLLNKMDGEYTTKIEGHLNLAKLEDLL